MPHLLLCVDIGSGLRVFIGEYGIEVWRDMTGRSRLLALVVRRVIG
jgi:hypothetical protein